MGNVIIVLVQDETDPHSAHEFETMEEAESWVSAVQYGAEIFSGNVSYVYLDETDSQWKDWDGQVVKDQGVLIGIVWCVSRLVAEKKEAASKKRAPYA